MFLSDHQKIPMFSAMPAREALGSLVHQNTTIVEHRPLAPYIAQTTSLTARQPATVNIEYRKYVAVPMSYYPQHRTFISVAILVTLLLYQSGYDDESDNLSGDDSRRDSSKTTVVDAREAGARAAKRAYRRGWRFVRSVAHNVVALATEAMTAAAAAASSSSSAGGKDDGEHVEKGHADNEPNDDRYSEDEQGTQHQHAEVVAVRLERNSNEAAVTECEEERQPPLPSRIERTSGGAAHLTAKHKGSCHCSAVAFEVRGVRSSPSRCVLVYS